MNTSITEVKELMNKVITLKNNMPWSYGRNERDVLKTCEILEILGWEWGHLEMKEAKDKYEKLLKEMAGDSDD